MKLIAAERADVIDSGVRFQVQFPQISIKELIWLVIKLQPNYKHAFVSHPKICLQVKIPGKTSRT